MSHTVLLYAHSVNQPLSIHVTEQQGNHVAQNSIMMFKQHFPCTKFHTIINFLCPVLKSRWCVVFSSYLFTLPAFMCFQLLWSSTLPLMCCTCSSLSHRPHCVYEQFLRWPGPLPHPLHLFRVSDATPCALTLKTMSLFKLYVLSAQLMIGIKRFFSRIVQTQVQTLPWSLWWVYSDMSDKDSMWFPSVFPTALSFTHCTWPLLGPCMTHSWLICV